MRKFLMLAAVACAFSFSSAAITPASAAPFRGTAHPSVVQRRPMAHRHMGHVRHGNHRQHSVSGFRR